MHQSVRYMIPINIGPHLSYIHPVFLDVQMSFLVVTFDLNTAPTCKIIIGQLWIYAYRYKIIIQYYVHEYLLNLIALM